MNNPVGWFQVSICPFCDNIGNSILCDNDCKTLICSQCNKEYYIDSEGNIIEAHDPQCGID